MRAHVVAKEQGELFPPASGQPDMNMSAPRTGQLAKIAFGQFRVISASFETNLS